MRPLLLVLALAAMPGVAGDREFDQAVKAFEQQYGKRKLSIPFFGVATFLVKAARPAGARDLKLAVFEDIDSRRHPAPGELDEMMRPMGAGGWLPFVRVHNRRAGERVQIYSRRKGTKDWELMIATLERNEAVLMRVRLNPESVAKWMNSPGRMARDREW